MWRACVRVTTLFAGGDGDGEMQHLDSLACVFVTSPLHRRVLTLPSFLAFSSPSLILRPIPGLVTPKLHCVELVPLSREGIHACRGARMLPRLRHGTNLGSSVNWRTNTASADHRQAVNSAILLCLLCRMRVYPNE